MFVAASLVPTQWEPVFLEAVVMLFTHQRQPNYPLTTRGHLIAVVIALAQNRAQAQTQQKQHQTATFQHLSYLQNVLTNMHV